MIKKFSDKKKSFKKWTSQIHALTSNSKTGKKFSIFLLVYMVPHNINLAHSHPILVTFCALMYYERIQEKLSDLNSYDIISMYNHSRVHPNSVGVKETSEENKETVDDEADQDEK